jgi:dTMP kinase
MKINPYPGLFIDIEGLDGCGASTQVELVKKLLRAEKFACYTTKEPTDNVIGGLIRGALTGIYQLPPEALQLLFVADRSHHLERQIIPILNDGNILITDRFCWSTIAFGSVNLNRNWLLQLHRYCFIPDLSFFLRISPKTSVKRLRADRFNFELFEEENKMWKAWDTYEWLAKKFSQEIIVVDGEKDPEEICAEILKRIKKHPKIKKIKKNEG